MSIGLCGSMVAVVSKKPSTLNFGKPIRVLHISTAKSWRGGEQQIAYLTEGLSENGVEQIVFCPKNSPLENHCLKTGISVEAYSKWVNIDLKAAFLIKKICVSNQITLVHAHDSPAHTLAILSHSLFGNPASIIVHRRVDFKIGKSGWFSNWKYNHHAVNRIICVSNFIKDLISPSLKKPEKLAVVHSGIDLSFFSKTNEDQGDRKGLRESFQIPLNTLLIANVAAIAPHKDYFTFVDTAEILLGNGLNAKFLAIGGDGGLMEAVQAYINKKGLQESIILTGFRDTIKQELRELDILLFTSKTEGLGTSLLDAFAAGVPVVSTNAGGIPEMVEHGKTGLLCDTGDSACLAKNVQALAFDKNLRSQLVRNASLKVQEFSKDKMATSIIELYQAALAG